VSLSASLRSVVFRSFSKLVKRFRGPLMQFVKLTSHPHFVRVSALRATKGFLDRSSFRSETDHDRHKCKHVRKRLSDTLRPLRRSDPEVRAFNGFGYIGSEGPLGSSRDRQCGEPPFLLCLSAQGCWQDRSDDRATLDGLKRFRLLSGLV